MTKAEFLAKVAELYVVGNKSDSDAPEDWTHHSMSGAACCALLDKMLHNMTKAGVLKADELQGFYDNM